MMVEVAKKDYESGIDGEATMIFGGKIGAKVYSTKVGGKLQEVVAIKELNHKVEVGADGQHYDEETFKELDSQVHMVFDNVESIEVVQRWLAEAKIRLTRREFTEELRKIKESQQ